MHGDISAVLDQALVIVDEMDALILVHQQRSQDHIERTSITTSGVGDCFQ
jgi:hypothetical protein